MLLRLSMVMNDMEKVVLAVFEDHEYTFVLEDNLDQMYKVWVRQLCA